MWQSEAGSVSATVANVQDVTNNTVSYGLTPITWLTWTFSNFLPACDGYGMAMRTLNQCHNWYRQ